jgi:hypothetical protein
MAFVRSKQVNSNSLPTAKRRAASNRAEHAIIERAQKSFCGYPDLHFHEDAMHYCDLSRRTAEAEQRNTQPDARCLP